MKDEKRHLYRVDPAKVQQKIYEMYPANSIVRKQMLDDAKKMELDRISKTMGSFPFELTNVLLDNAIKRGIKTLLFAVAWFVGLSLSVVLLMTYATTILELGLLGGLIVFCFLNMINKLSISVQEIFAAQKLSKSVTKMIDKVSALKKKMEK